MVSLGEEISPYRSRWAKAGVAVAGEQPERPLSGGRQQPQIVAAVPVRIVQGEQAPIREALLDHPACLWVAAHVGHLFLTAVRGHHIRPAIPVHVGHMGVSGVSAMFISCPCEGPVPLVVRDEPTGVAARRSVRRHQIQIPVTVHVAQTAVWAIGIEALLAQRVEHRRRKQPSEGRGSGHHRRRQFSVQQLLDAGQPDPVDLDRLWDVLQAAVPRHAHRAHTRQRQPQIDVFQIPVPQYRTRTLVRSTTGDAQQYLLPLRRIRYIRFQGEVVVDEVLHRRPGDVVLVGPAQPEVPVHRRMMHHPAAHLHPVEQR
ncbi:MAG: hypothetical protein WDA75_09400 [Candidatus Latescibacterota bacterium]|jgi:hypothetical protein